jgi:hypothetical protein
MRRGGRKRFGPARIAIDNSKWRPCHGLRGILTLRPLFEHVSMLFYSVGP